MVTTVSVVMEMPGAETDGEAVTGVELGESVPPPGLLERLDELDGAAGTELTEGLALTLGDTVRETEGEKEGSAGPTKMDVALTTAPV